MKYIFSVLLMAFVAVNMNAQSCCASKDKAAKTEQCSGEAKAKKDASCHDTAKSQTTVSKTVKKEDGLQKPMGKKAPATLRDEKKSTAVKKD